MTGYLAHHLPTGRTAQVEDVGALHDLLTGWLAGAPLADLAAVDVLCLALELGRARADLQVALRLEVDALP